MSSYSNSLKQPVASGDRDGLLSEELRVEQFVSMVEQLPAVLAVHCAWGLIFFLTVAHYHPWPIVMMAAMAVSLVMGSLSYWQLKRSTRPEKITTAQILQFAMYAGLSGIFWSVGMLVYLPTMPSEVSILLAIGCIFMMTLAAEIMYAIPIASFACAIPIFFTGFYISSLIWPAMQLTLASLTISMAAGTFWIVFKNQRAFMATSRALVERGQFLAASKAAIATRNQFLENVSHEIKTPLTAVLGHAKLLLAEKSKMSADHGETLEHLDVSALALLKTIDTLLDVTKLNAGQLPLQEDIFDVSRLVEQAVLSMKKDADEKSIDLYFEVNSDVPKSLVGDAQRVEQIVLNLLGNAVKFTSSGHVRVVVNCDLPSTPSNNQKMLCIAVSDTGIGIDNSKRESIFRSFYQVDGSITRRHGGMGLGLTVSRMLANLMNGDLEFESDGRNGSTFRCWLPLKFEKKEALETPRTALKRDCDPSKPLNLLVVDDDVYIRHYLDVLFSSDGWHVDLSEDGPSAIEQCSRQEYDLILMDIQMPEMTGIDASRIIWSKKHNENTPILALTGYLSVDRIAELRQAGLVEYLGKPLAPEQLLAKAHQMAARSSSAMPLADGSA